MCLTPATWPASSPCLGQLQIIPVPGQKSSGLEGPDLPFCSKDMMFPFPERQISVCSEPRDPNPGKRYAQIHLFIHHSPADTSPASAYGEHESSGPCPCSPRVNLMFLALGDGEDRRITDLGESQPWSIPAPLASCVLLDKSLHSLSSISIFGKEAHCEGSDEI